MRRRVTGTTSSDQPTKVSNSILTGSIGTWKVLMSLAIGAARRSHGSSRVVNKGAKFIIRRANKLRRKTLGQNRYDQADSSQNGTNDQPDHRWRHTMALMLENVSSPLLPGAPGRNPQHRRCTSRLCLAQPPRLRQSKDDAHVSCLPIRGRSQDGPEQGQTQSHSTPSATTTCAP